MSAPGRLEPLLADLKSDKIKSRKVLAPITRLQLPRRCRRRCLLVLSLLRRSLCCPATPCRRRSSC